MPTKKTITPSQEIKKPTVESVPAEEAKPVQKPRPKKVERKQFKPGDMIPCKCLRPNKVVFHSGKTGARYYWFGYGDIVDVDYSDLMAMKSAKMSYLYKPLIMILDEDLVSQWSRDLDPIYENFTVYENLDDFFELPQSVFEAKLSNSTPGFQDLIKTLTSRKIKDGTLDSLAKIRAIDAAFNTSFAEFL